MSENGYNPITWDCDKNGCFNRRCRPKIEQFSGALPGRNAFGDVDAITEQNGYFLLLEWKNSGSRELRGGQEIMYRRMTQDNRWTVMVIVGNAETMKIISYSTFRHGQRYPQNNDISASLEDINNYIRAWCRAAWRNETLEYGS